MTPSDYGNYANHVCEILGGSACDTWLELYANSIKSSFGIPSILWDNWEVKLSYVGRPMLYVIHRQNGKYVYENGSFGE